jgi:hypothetical protein
LLFGRWKVDRWNVAPPIRGPANCGLAIDRDMPPDRDPPPALGPACAAVIVIMKISSATRAKVRFAFISRVGCND